MDMHEIRYKGVDWTKLAYDMIQWAFVNMVPCFRVP